MLASLSRRICTPLVCFLSLYGALASAEAFTPRQAAIEAWCDATIWSDVRVPSSRASEPVPETAGAMARFAPSNLLYSLALSGGGFRAMIFHLGTLRRLNDAGLLSRMTLITSVSGGSITAAYLAYKWPRLTFDLEGKATNFGEEIEQPLRELGNTTIDIPAALTGLILPLTTTSNQLATSLDIGLFRHGPSSRAMLSDIAPGITSAVGNRPRPVFVFVATSLQTAEMWQFRSRAMGGPTLGWTNTNGIALADAVAASAGFPPVFSSLNLDLSSRHPELDWHECTEPRDNPFGIDHRNVPARVLHPDELPKFRRALVLADGGIRDNIGISVIEETNRIRTMRSRGRDAQTATFISDAGLTTQMQLEPASNWWSVFRRVAEMMSDEPNDVRIANIVRTASADHLERTGYSNFFSGKCDPKSTFAGLRQLELQLLSSSDKYAYWSIRRTPKNHQGMGCPSEDSQLEHEIVALSKEPTRLAALDAARQARLINWGYMAAHHGIPYIANLSADHEFITSFLTSCKIPYGVDVVDPLKEYPGARDVACYANHAM